MASPFDGCRSYPGAGTRRWAGRPGANLQLHSASGASLSREELAAETDLPLDILDWMGTIGILRSEDPDRFPPGDAQMVPGPPRWNSHRAASKVLAGIPKPAAAASTTRISSMSPIGCPTIGSTKLRRWTSGLTVSAPESHPEPLEGSDPQVLRPTLEVPAEVGPMGPFRERLHRRKALIHQERHEAAQPRHPGPVVGAPQALRDCGVAPLVRGVPVEDGLEIVQGSDLVLPVVPVVLDGALDHGVLHLQVEDRELHVRDQVGQPWVRHVGHLRWRHALAGLDQEVEACAGDPRTATTALLGLIWD
jgi:hypothetical protein